MPPHKTKMDVAERLSVFRNICEHHWKTPAEIARSKFGLPYLKVGGQGRVHIVLHPNAKFVSMYFTMPGMDEQTVLHYNMDRTAGGKWMSDNFIIKICLFAAAISHRLEAEDFS